MHEFWHILSHTLVHTLEHTVGTLPFLLAVYLLTGWIETRTNAAHTMAKLPASLGVVAGALAGCLPQCGFSVAAASLYNGGYISAAVLISVFLSTSDEAFPILLSNMDDIGTVLLLMAVKVAVAIGAGLLLKATVFRHEKLYSFSHAEVHEAADAAEYEAEHHGCGCGCHDRPFWLEAIIRTAKTALYLAVTLFAINLAFELIGEENVQALLLSDHFLQPLLCTIIGMIPGCAPSVLLAELFLSGGITFGSAVAGLSAGAGFGYLVLLRSSSRRKAGWIMLWTLIPALVCGTIIHLFGI